MIFLFRFDSYLKILKNKMTKSIEKTCPDCNGTESYGFMNMNHKGNGDCKNCDGTGYVTEVFTNALSKITFVGLLLDENEDFNEPCSICDRTGQCQTCGGTGFVYEQEENEKLSDELIETTSSIEKAEEKEEEKKYDSDTYDYSSYESSEYSYTNYEPIENRSRKNESLIIFWIIALVLFVIIINQKNCSTNTKNNSVKKIKQEQIKTPSFQLDNPLDSDKPLKIQRKSTKNVTQEQVNESNLVTRICSNCEGNGSIQNNQTHPCGSCSGTGKKACYTCSPVPCPNCKA